MTVFNTIDNLNVAGKKVLIRLDLNVPMKNGTITNKERLLRSTTTVKELVAKKAKVIILSHLGRPKGTGYEAEFSLKPVAEEFSKILNQKIEFCSDCIGKTAEDTIAKMHDGDIVMLENVRFYKEETQNDPTFTKKLAALGDLYVSDAFSAAHRAHSSTEGLGHLLPSAAGRLMEEELNALQTSLENPKKPVLVIIGGAKVSTKLDVFHNIVKKVQYIIIGGGMANTFLYATGVDVGDSLCEKDMVEECNKIIDEARKNNCILALPVDGCAAKTLEPNVETKIVDNSNLPDGYKLLDAGPQSIENFKKISDECKTVVWNGPLGVFEVPPFEKATFALAKHIARLTKENKIISLAGGGDTVSALTLAGVYDDFSYISTAGGAFLEWMEGKTLPGVEILKKNK